MILAYNFVYQAIAAVGHADHTTSVPLSVADREKYGNNRLPDFVRESIIAKLTEHMRVEQPWLKIDLTLSELASAINLNPHHLSQIINSEFGKSFACFINEYRVDAARRLLSVSDNRTVIEIALDSGFASKSSFNALFKKHTGVTPSEYRRISRGQLGAEQLQQVS
jgi:AraC-like DNA-binding protein